MLLLGVVSSVYAQDDDFTTWTKFKINHKIDSQFSVSGDVELRTKDDLNKWDPNLYNKRSECHRRKIHRLRYAPDQYPYGSVGSNVG